ncbi:GSCFA domain-containing protein [Flavobacterium sp.]|uniref:GSCFA domain-containing protein n=1 Tax=Flavobacterium sp. TaxID=239 RepID=UPI00286BFCD7|nr:GSCFA domain-containing protein [Flavobacterium sp.]
MNFTTQISIPKANNPLDYSSKIVLLGSCFSENIGAKFEYFKFQNTVNPFGIIFNPVSIEKLIERVVNQIEYTEKDIFFHNERWHCYEVHSDLSHENKNEFLENLNAIIKFTHQQILQSTHLIVTYGTSWIYKLKSTNEVVANCHKMPQKEFSKEILSVEIIEKSIQNTIDLIHKINPNCNFIFTISPVRHIKDGFIENQRSKAHLISALHSSCFQLPTSSYFPSYEIMMDELRDYRFYAEDLLHPNQIAIDYIWERFSATSISEQSLLIMHEVETIRKGMAHRPFNPNSQSHQQFLSKLQDKIVVIQNQFPQIYF